MKKVVDNEFRYFNAKRRFLLNRWTTIVRQVLDTGARGESLGLIPEVFEGPFAKKLDAVCDAAIGKLEESEENKTKVWEYCEEIVKDIWQRPGMGYRFVVPEEFWESQVGEIIISARMWADDDKLITATEASRISKKSLSTLNRMIASGKLTRYSEHREPNPQKRSRFSKNEVMGLLMERKANEQTPWGDLDDDPELFVDGVSFVTTPSHGGLKISIEFAEKHMSDAAIRRGVLLNGNLFYEEDCAWAIAVFDLPEYWFDMVKSGFPYHFDDVEALDKALKDILRTTYPDYLAETGMMLDGFVSQVYINQRENEEANDITVANWDMPNFIIKIETEGEDIPEGAALVHVANKGTYLVKRPKKGDEPLFLDLYDVIKPISVRGLSEMGK